MHAINLDPTFAPFGEGVIRDISRPFPSGAEVNVLLDAASLPREIRLTCRLSSSDSILKLLMATDACRRLGAESIHLFVPYLPYARQDRVCRAGEAFSLQVMGDLLNAQNYATVTVFDVHSPVALAAVRRLRSLDNHTFVSAALTGRRDYVLVSPDLGAAKKMIGVAEALGYAGRPVQCDKYRAQGGAVDHIDIPRRDFEGREAIIVDDICDGGATFTTLATELKLRNAGLVSLVVSHGIFSRGLDILRDGGLDHVYTTDSFKSHEPNDFLTEIKLCKILT